MRLRMPKLYELEKEGYQCFNCGRHTWHRWFPHRQEWVCTCRFNEAWAELKAQCLSERLKKLLRRLTK